MNFYMSAYIEESDRDALVDLYLCFPLIHRDSKANTEENHRSHTLKQRSRLAQKPHTYARTDRFFLLYGDLSP